MLDIFRSNAFGVTSLTDGINKAPFKPGRIGALGLFRERGIRTTSVTVEERSGQLSLIQTSPRGGTPSTIGTPKRTARSFTVPHLEREAKIMADEVQNVRAFGSEDQTLAVQTLVDERLADLRAMHEVTLEHLRIGAIKGLVLDADGTTLLNLFTEFGVSQQTAVLSVDADADQGDDLRAQIRSVQRLAEAELGAEPITGYRAFCGVDFIDYLRSDLGVVQTLRYADPQILRQQQLAGQEFPFGGVMWEEYRGSTGGTPFVPDAEAYLVPEGPDIFRTYFAPADYIEAVNTLGLPMYVKSFIDAELQRWVKLHSQSNPLAICTRPRAVIKLTLTT
jgi:hypothetical protein